MKINQEKESKSVTITLETEEEVDFLWDFIEDYYESDDWLSDRRKFMIDLANHLGELNG